MPFRPCLVLFYSKFCKDHGGRGVNCQVVGFPGCRIDRNLPGPFCRILVDHGGRLAVRCLRFYCGVPVLPGVHPYQVRGCLFFVHVLAFLVCVVPGVVAPDWSPFRSRSGVALSIPCAGISSDKGRARGGVSDKI